MSDTARQQVQQQVIEEFRAGGGKVGGQFAGMDLLLLTTTGARSGESRTWPLGYQREDDRLIVFAANGGRANRPGWYFNLVADPSATVEVGTETWPVTAVLATGAERERLWERQLVTTPFLAGFQAKVEWEIPVFVLTRAGV
ncbi:nitroreductase family deazaflavin-dependent oxidoreductase [Nocardia sp. NPDC088792]|uniref:nitroreductase family deazaflavin-dependent oxidoreductase n=1 Tax=Nocardia sp. NPDC088792 TaxID=3364332 RepID=UPI0037F66A05